MLNAIVKSEEWKELLTAESRKPSSIYIQRKRETRLPHLHTNSFSITATSHSMSTRARQSTASVVPSSQHPASTATNPNYEPPQFALNPEAQRALADLARKHQLKQLDDSFENAQSAITLCAAGINEQLSRRETHFKKLRQRQQASHDGEGEVDLGAAEAELEGIRVKVENMTKRMEEGMRKMIDGRHAIEHMKGSVASVADAARAEASTQASTLNTRSQGRRRRGGDGEDDEDANEEEEYQDFTPTDPAGGTQPVLSVSGAWMRKIDDEKMRYQNFTMAQRYAKENDYINFKGMVHSSRFPDGDLQQPHASTWFTENGAVPQPGVTGAGEAGDEDDDDDIQIQRSKTSTKCPLTLQEFKDPVTSSKCQHSFEASAIMEMLRNSSDRIGGQRGPRGGQTGEKAVRCPVASCDHMLTKADLKVDPVVRYTIQRLQRARRLEEEEDEDDEGEDGEGRSGRRRPQLIEDDEPDVDDFDEGPGPGPVKREPRGTARSRASASAAPRNSRAVDSGDEVDDDGDATMEQW